MSASAEAQDNLENIEAFIRDLVPASSRKKEKKLMAKSWDFGPSLMTEEAIKALEDEGCFPMGKGRPSRRETISQLEVDEAVVSKDFFSCSFRIP